MAQFILNRNSQSNGDHEVHNKTDNCSFLPNYENQIDLGYHANCHDAVATARRLYPNWRINGCKHCCNACHTS